MAIGDVESAGDERRGKRSLLRGLRNHIRSNAVGYVALLMVSGAAGALQGRNTVFSDDIVNGQVKRSDLNLGAIATEKIRDGEVGTSHFGAEAITGSNIAGGSLSGIDVADNSLTGDDVGSVEGSDIIEGSLSEVPEASVAGRGRMAQGGVCDPESASYVSCVAVSFSLPVQGRVFIHGYGNGRTEVDSDQAFGDCALYSSATGRFPETVRINADDITGGEFGISVVTGPIGPGQVSFEVHCNQLAPPGAIRYRKVGITAVQIGPS